MLMGIASDIFTPLSLDERLALIRRAGYDAVLLNWNILEDGGVPLAERVALAKKHNLEIENAHASILPSLNDIWQEGEAGDEPIRILLEETEAAARHGIARLVMHVSNTNCPPPICDIGTERFGRVVRRAGEVGVSIAFENVRPTPHVHHILDVYRQPWIGFCYDSGHENNWTPENDWLSVYGDRLFALHLHDNRRDGDMHQHPFDGNACWERIARGIANSGYRGSLSLESYIPATGLYMGAKIAPEEFLRRGMDALGRLDAMIEEYRNKKSI